MMSDPALISGYASSLPGWDERSQRLSYEGDSYSLAQLGELVGGVLSAVLDEVVAGGEGGEGGVRGGGGGGGGGGMGSRGASPVAAVAEAKAEGAARRGGGDDDVGCAGAKGAAASDSRGEYKD